MPGWGLLLHNQTKLENADIKINANGVVLLISFWIISFGLSMRKRVWAYIKMYITAWLYRPPPRRAYQHELVDPICIHLNNVLTTGIC